jgi:cholesterol transport system auxiliary component
MTAMNLFRTTHFFVRLLAALCTLSLAACSLIKPTSSDPAAFYSLNRAPTASQFPAADKSGKNLPTLIVTPPRAAAGFDSQRIIYIRHDHQLEYFAHSEWVDTPARMLGPLLASRLEATDAFGAVVLTPAGASGDLRLETEIIRLQHNFQSDPSAVQFTLRAFLLDEKTRRVLVWKEFQADAISASDSPHGGVAAANQAVQAVLTELAQFVAAHSR